jgi:hypothetical protein
MEAVVKILPNENKPPLNKFADAVLGAYDACEAAAKDRRATRHRNAERLLDLKEVEICSGSSSAWTLRELIASARDVAVRRPRRASHQSRRDQARRRPPSATTARRTRQGLSRSEDRVSQPRIAADPAEEPTEPSMEESSREEQIWKERLVTYFSILREWDRKLAQRTSAGYEGSHHP